MTITVIRLNGKRISRTLRTAPGQMLKPSGVDGVLHNEADRLEQYFPGAEFRLVPLLDGKFNFVEIEAQAVPVENAEQAS